MMKAPLLGAVFLLLLTDQTHATILHGVWEHDGLNLDGFEMSRVIDGAHTIIDENIPASARTTQIDVEIAVGECQDFANRAWQNTATGRKYSPGYAYAEGCLEAVGPNNVLIFRFE